MDVIDKMVKYCKESFICEDCIYGNLCNHFTNDKEHCWNSPTWWREGDVEVVKRYYALRKFGLIKNRKAFYGES